MSAAIPFQRFLDHRAQCAACQAPDRSRWCALGEELRSAAENAALPSVGAHLTQEFRRQKESN